MRFLDPMPCRCPSCGAENAVRVRDLLGLTARCPGCGSSFRDSGLSMRGMVDDTTAFFYAIQIIMNLEQQFGITIADDSVEAIRSWDALTLRDLAVAAEHSASFDLSRSIDEAVRLAVRKEFPDAPEPVDFAKPLLEAIPPKRRYGGY